MDAKYPYQEVKTLRCETIDAAPGYFAYYIWADGVDGKTSPINEYHELDADQATQADNLMLATTKFRQAVCSGVASHWKHPKTWMTGVVKNDHPIMFIDGVYRVLNTGDGDLIDHQGEFETLQDTFDSVEVALWFNLKNHKIMVFSWI